MANIKTIVDVFESTAASMRVDDNQSPAVQIAPAFIYDRVSAINGEPSKVYPAILLDSNADVKREKATTGFLPAQNTYTFKLFVYDTYNFNQQPGFQGGQNIDLQTKQAKVETIINQYVAEVQKRMLNLGFGLTVHNIQRLEGFFGKDVHNSKLVQIYYKIEVNSGSNCVPGTFV